MAFELDLEHYNLYYKRAFQAKGTEQAEGIYSKLFHLIGGV
jgi:hypothetical protein